MFLQTGEANDVIRFKFLAKLYLKYVPNFPGTSPIPQLMGKPETTKPKLVEAKLSMEKMQDDLRERKETLTLPEIKVTQVDSRSLPFPSKTESVQPKESNFPKISQKPGSEEKPDPERAALVKKFISQSVEVRSEAEVEVPILSAKWLIDKFQHLSGLSNKKERDASRSGSPTADFAACYLITNFYSGIFVNRETRTLNNY